MKLHGMFNDYIWIAVFCILNCVCSNKKCNADLKENLSNINSRYKSDITIAHSLRNIVSNMDKRSKSDTIVASSRNIPNIEDFYFIPDTTSLSSISLQEVMNISNIKDVVDYSEPIMCKKVSRNNGLNLFLLMYEGEDFFSYLCSVVNNNVVDYLYVDGIEAEPGRENRECELTTFVILENYDIKVTTTKIHDGIQTIIEKIYSLADNGKFIHLK